MGVPGIDPSGTMDYPTAIKWVRALNDYNGRAGYLGHRDWQLPTTPARDDSCAIPHGRSGNAFGPSCTASALGNLHSHGFGKTFPATIVPPSGHSVGPFVHLQQGLYWAGGEDDKRPPTAEDSPNAHTCTFTTGAKNRKTTEANYFYVLPMVPGHIGRRAPSGDGVVPYDAGPAKGLAVYDTVARVTWLRDGALAASQQGHFGLDHNVEISFDRRNTPTLRAPAIDASGAMQFATAHKWLRRLNARAYAGSEKWELPTVLQLQQLRQHLGSAVDERLLERGPAGPFTNLQVFFYWSTPSPTRGGPTGWERAFPGAQARSGGCWKLPAAHARPAPFFLAHRSTPMKQRITRRLTTPLLAVAAGTSAILIGCSDDVEDRTSSAATSGGGAAVSGAGGASGSANATTGSCCTNTTTSYAAYSSAETGAGGAGGNGGQGGSGANGGNGGQGGSGANGAGGAGGT